MKLETIARWTAIAVAPAAMGAAFLRAGHTGAVLGWAFAVVIAGIVFMAWACWHRAHDGSMTGRAELAEDIREDTGSRAE